MGESYSKEDEAIFMSDLFNIADSYGMMPDIGIDDTLMRFSGLDSTAVLQDYSSQLRRRLADKAPSYTASLGSALARFSRVPNAVGLGALIISLILDFSVITIASQNSASTLNMLRRVFAEEKASGVRDTMDEYMKRLKMHMWEPLKALEETERLEKQLSYQLTSLKNSMLHDGQMSTDAMKYWINGAAFHSQMLIHNARLKMGRSSPNHEMELEVRITSISTVVEIYRVALQELMKKYKTHKRKTIRLEKASSLCLVVLGVLSCDDAYCQVRDEENRKVEPPPIKHNRFGNKYCKNSLDAYIDYMFNNWNLIKQLDEYFLDLKKNLRELILQRQAFSG